MGMNETVLIPRQINNRPVMTVNLGLGFAREEACVHKSSAISKDKTITC